MNGEMFFSFSLLREKVRMRVIKKHLLMITLTPILSQRERGNT